MHSPLGIALGGGGMKGWAHLGAIGVFERLGLRPDVLAGTSAGALIGAFWAAGFAHDEMVRLMRAQRTAALFSFRFDGVGLYSQDGFRAYLTEHLGDRTFADLPVPFYVVATDIEAGREVVLSKGPLVPAVLASTAMPGIFAPVEVGGRLLVDGGITNNLPVSALVHAGVRYTVGVRLQRPDVSGPLRRGAGEGRVGMALWAERLAQRFHVGRAGMPSGLDVAGRALDLVTAQVGDLRLRLHPPDVLLTPDVARYGLLSFSEDKQAIYACGVAAAEAKEADLRALAARVGVGKEVGDGR